MAMSGEEKDWSELPAELLHLIAKKLPDLLDFVRFRVICKTWCSSAPLSDPPYQHPWLLELFPRDCNYCIHEKQQRYYSFSSCEMLTIPSIDGKPVLDSWIYGGVCTHYLAFLNHTNTMSFFNPLTKDLFLLPPMHMHLCCGTPWMVWTGADPIRNRSIVVLDRDRYLGNLKGGWAFYDPRNKKWIEEKGYFYSSCYWQGMLFSTRDGNPTKVFNAYSKKLLHVIPPPENELIEDSYFKDELAWYLRESYLVVSSGVILRVSWFYDCHVKISESVFHIYRLDYGSADGKPFWVRIGDIGDQILFLDEMNGFSMTCKPSSGFREGCIYFLDPNQYKPYVHDVLAGTVERVPCPFKRCTWFLPSLS
ncbi:hypothetical protein LUZ63_004024 [Rhynchospora breviuscula]|uniref:KIB1-4 beta-propeller domain-containing protein n=1 Tax=Rhynchospora breviuscula TaxID=2022672 RepID=A0A9Q0D1Q0_9POAL|nr:hypothetical protein LUZ63_004024 [Rhynchospora breviuscula]